MAKRCSFCGGKIKNGICCDCGMSYYDENDSFDVHEENAQQMPLNEEKFENLNRSSNNKNKNKNKTRDVLILIIVIGGLSSLVVTNIPKILKKLFSSESKPKFSDGTPYVTMPEIPKISDIVIPKIEIPDVGIDDDLRKAIENDLEVLNRQYGVWQQGTYKTGEDIPFGTYLVAADTEQHFSVRFSSDEQGDEDISLQGSMSAISRYITINSEGILDIKSGKLYDTEKNDIVNDPHEHGGMFLVGRDIEPGTYELVLDPDIITESDDYTPAASYKIYLDADIKEPVLKEQGELKESITITVNDGEFLELDKCIIS